MCGVSELFALKAVLHRFMVEENKSRESNGEELLSRPPKPCEHFDLIAGTGTGGYATDNILLHSLN